jgi:hypothetical protein
VVGALVVAGGLVGGGCTGTGTKTVCGGWVTTGGGVGSNTGQCTGLFWGGERQWLHGVNRPGGRYFCFFDGDDAVIVWSHRRLEQPSHLDILGKAREGGSDHAGLTDWWRPWHHRIGKAN